MQNRTVKISKFLSRVLRHKPETIGLTLDSAGWAPVAELLTACQQHNFPISLEELQAAVANNDKNRFSFSEDGCLIRANQGHSITIELGYPPVEPPPLLYHGTAERFLSSIKAKGLLKGKRHHVHLSSNISTATKVGKRHGQPLVLAIKSGPMHSAGYVFYQAANGVWLTEYVPVAYIEMTNDQ